MPATPSSTRPTGVRCLIWGRPDSPDTDSLELEQALGAGGWNLSVRGRTGADAAGEFDIILVEDPGGMPADLIRRLRPNGTLAVAMLRGPVPAERLEPYDVFLCGDLPLAKALRGAGKAAWFIPSGMDRAARCLGILERQWRYRKNPPEQVDWSRISYGHTPIGKDDVTGRMTSAWQSEEIPARQRALVQTELMEMYRGNIPRVYGVLAEALRPYACDGLGVLEIGCASGYYSEILEYLLNRRLDYEGADYSEALIRMARGLYPDRTFHVADGAALPFAAGRFPVAISSCVLLHVPNYRDHIRETARVAGRVVVAHRTPVCRKRPTQYLKKFAYGVETVELLFNEAEILAEFAKHGLDLRTTIDLGGDAAQDEHCLTYVFEKSPDAVPQAPEGAAVQDAFADLLRQGERAFASGDLAAAKEFFLRAARIEPGNPTLLNDQGVLHCQAGEVTEGLDCLTRAHAAAPDDRKILENLVAILSALDQEADAAPLLDAFLRRHPGNSGMREMRDQLAPSSRSAAVPSATPAGPRPLSVAWRNRADMVHAKGGDGTVIEETIQALKAQGHRADIRLEPTPDLSGYDLVHLNNISRSQDTLEHLRHARRAGKPAVLTALYEDMDRYLRPAMKTDLLFRYLATRKQPVPLEGIPHLLKSFELEKDPLDDPLARQLGIGDPVRQEEILKGVDLVLTSGRGESESIRRKFGAVAPIREMHYGFNRSYRDADGRLFEQRHGLKDFALCVGRLEPRKNQWQLIEVFRSLPGLKLVLVGVFSDPSMEPLIRSYAPPNVIFFPRLPLEELASAYAAARLHVLPSWYELPGLVSLEAAAAGCRVATTDWGTAPDYFGGFAHYLSPDDPVGIRKVVQEAFDSAPKPGMREHVLGAFSWEKTAASAVEAYRSVLGGR